MQKFLILYFLLLADISYAQTSPDTAKSPQLKAMADDPSNFFTRVEVYNELQHYDNDVYVNQTILRNIIQIGKRFTTRLDLPYVYNSVPHPANDDKSGLGDISFRVLGYKLREKPRSAITASIEFSLNTAESRFLGTGKNILIPMVTYTGVNPEKKMLYSGVFQQANSVGGNNEREDISFSKLQLILLKRFSKKTWMVLAPEWFVDYVHGGVSMNMRSRFAYAPKPRINIWITPSIGVFGDFVGRYQWSADIGGRYFIFRKNTNDKK